MGGAKSHQNNNIEVKCHLSNIKRIHTLDEIRGFAVFCMIFYHIFYTLGTIFEIKFFDSIMLFFKPAEPIFAGLFIFISGIASQLSHSNIKRGIILFVISMGVTLVTYLFMRQSTIWFGVLHLLSISMILFGFLKKIVCKIPMLIGIIINVLLFIYTVDITKGYLSFFGFLKITLPNTLYQNNLFAGFGFYNHDTFISADYFSIFPWVFLFFCGGFFGKLAVENKFPKFMYNKHISFFSLLGRNALIIYVVHQPIIYGVALVIQKLYH